MENKIDKKPFFKKTSATRVLYLALGSLILCTIFYITNEATWRFTSNIINDILYFATGILGDIFLLCFIIGLIRLIASSLKKEKDMDGVKNGWILFSVLVVVFAIIIISAPLILIPTISVIGYPLGFAL